MTGWCANATVQALSEGGDAPEDLRSSRGSAYAGSRSAGQMNSGERLRIVRMESVNILEYMSNTFLVRCGPRLCDSISHT